MARNCPCTAHPAGSAILPLCYLAAAWSAARSCSRRYISQINKSQGITRVAYRMTTVDQSEMRLVIGAGPDSKLVETLVADAPRTACAVLWWPWQQPIGSRRRSGRDRRQARSRTALGRGVAVTATSSGGTGAVRVAVRVERTEPLRARLRCRSRLSSHGRARLAAVGEQRPGLAIHSVNPAEGNVR